MAGLISIIVTTYDREDALGAVLRALARQGDRSFEVVIADDGSGPATGELVESWKSRLGVPLTHIWQCHAGFRAAEIRDRAILASQGDYCVFLDGDCIPRPDFVAVHRRLAEPGWFVTGNRILLSETLTEFVLQPGRGPEQPELWSFGTWFGLRISRSINRLAPLLHLPLGQLRKRRPQQWEQARSCNLAVWRCDLDQVDGFDTQFNGWGREDSDLLVRLLHAGVCRKDGNFATGVLHLWHPEADRSMLQDNDDRLLDAVRSQRVRALAGMSTLTAPSASAAADLVRQAEEGRDTRHAIEGHA